jgi:hypothetical protein
MPKFTCPWCSRSFKAGRASDYESCPHCRCSFSFQKPRLEQPEPAKEPVTIATGFPFLTIVVDPSVPEDVLEFRQKGATIGRFKIPGRPKRCPSCGSKSENVFISGTACAKVPGPWHREARAKFDREATPSSSPKCPKGHTAVDHERMGWTCDTPTPPAPDWKARAEKAVAALRYAYRWHPRPESAVAEALRYAESLTPAPTPHTPESGDSVQHDMETTCPRCLKPWKAHKAGEEIETICPT